MKCPYCEKEMKEGYIPVGQMKLQWLPKESKPPFLGTQIGKNGVKLSDFSYLSTIKAISYHCENCKIVITPVEPD